MHPDLVVIRHAAAGAPKYWLMLFPLPSSMRGTGLRASTQALLDAFTIREKKGRLEGLKVSIIGDIVTAGLPGKYGLPEKDGCTGNRLRPHTMIPRFIETMGVAVAPAWMRLCRCRRDHDARIQLERQNAFLFPSLREYAPLFGLNAERLKKGRKDVLIMHPGPVNPGVEISPEVADGPYAVILEQVTNGRAVRMHC